MDKRSNNNRVSGKKKRRKIQCLAILAFSELLGGFTFSLLSPFYTKEAQLKGISVTETGLVYGAAFITTIIFSPIFGKQIEVIGSKQLYVYGTFLAGSTNILFGFLQWVVDPRTFMVLSFFIRVVSSVGEAAFFSSIYPLAAQAADEGHRSTVLSVMETMFGLGLMLGPFFGGVLYEYGGFYLPFVVCGSALTFCTLFAGFFLNVPSDNDETSSNDQDGRSSKLTFWRLLKIPSIFISCLILCISSTSVSWYLPTFQPFLEENYQLGTIGIGGMLTLDGATYAVFSPLWGALLDRSRVSPLGALTYGTISILIGFSLLGPAPFLPFLPHSIYLVGFGLFIHGFGTAANFITTLTFMMSKSVDSGVSDTEQMRGMVTSVWFINECIGGYFGSTLGGLTYDLIGFEQSTLVVIFLQTFSLTVLLPLLNHFNKNVINEDDDEARTSLIESSSSDRINRYDSTTSIA